MLVTNVAPFKILVACYVEHKGFGPQHVVEPFSKRDIVGPVFFVIGDHEQYLNIKTMEFLITYNGEPDPGKGILRVGPKAPSSFEWMEETGRVGIRVVHFSDVNLKRARLV